MPAERIGRREFLAELGAGLRPGDHLSAIGPTGRGKSTTIGELIPHLRQFDEAVILSPKGRDPAYSKLGHPTPSWPPKMPLDERVKIFVGGDQRDRHRSQPGPKVWRIEVPLRKPEDFIKMRAAYSALLGGIMGRPERVRTRQLIVVDDSRFVCDPKSMGLEVPVRNGLIIGRSKGVSLVNNFQAPRWVPREGLDQITHGLIWRNRDRDVAKRLAEISGTIDPRELLDTITGLDYHEMVWVDGRADVWRIVNSR